MVEAGKQDFDTALRYETRQFCALAVSREAKNMISTFFFGLGQVNGGASRPKDIPRSKVNKLGILGAGMMGQGIAYSSAMAGIEVVLKDMTQEAADSGKAYTEKLLAKRVQRGRMDEEKAALVLDRIKASADMEDLRGCDMIIEAVFEKIKVKDKVIAETEEYLAENGVWGSNTSTLPITRLGSKAQNPQNFVGLHFFSPVDKMPLLEIIAGEETSDMTLARAFDFAQQIGKTPIIVGDKTGFYTSRTIGTKIIEGVQLVAEGHDPVRVDNLSRLIGMPTGMLSLLDEVQIKLVTDIYRTQIEMGLLDPAEEQTPRRGRCWRTCWTITTAMAARPARGSTTTPTAVRRSGPACPNGARTMPRFRIATFRTASCSARFWKACGVWKKAFCAAPPMAILGRSWASARRSIRGAISSTSTPMAWIASSPVVKN